ncbi:hypothetical protein D3C78_1735980 [compost metagenome]
MGQNSSSESSRLASMPPTAWRSSGVPARSSLANWLRPSASARLTCMCMPVPARSEKGLAMKQACMPWAWATPLTRRL